MSEAFPKSLHLFGVRVAYRSPSRTMKFASMSEPPSVIVALPCAAVAGAVVRSPVSVLMGNPGILPWTLSTRWALLTALVASADCLTRVVASGSGAPLCLEPDEQPAIKAVMRVRDARTADTRWRVCILCIVEGADDSPGGRRGAVSAGRGRLASSPVGDRPISLVECSPELWRNSERSPAAMSWPTRRDCPAGD